MARTSERTKHLAVTVLTTACFAIVLLASPAGAQDDSYPDGATEPTNPEPSGEVTCELSVEAGEPGDEVTAVVRNVPPAGGVRILFDGTEVASTTEGGAEVRVTFVVPDVDPGSYTVVASGPTFSVECSASFTVGDTTEVAGEQVERPGDDGSDDGGDDGSAVGGESTSRGSGGGGALPFTGAELGLLVAVALAMLVGGWRLRSAAKRRRAAHA